MCAAEVLPIVEPDEGSDRIRPLDVAACYALLATDTVGRVVYTEDALPAVTPVNYVLDGHHVVFRTAVDGRLARAVSGQVVAFEVDQLDRTTRTGWSVVVMGIASRIEPLGQPTRALAHGLAPWAGGRRDLFLAVTPGRVTGRSIG